MPTFLKVACKAMYVLSVIREKDGGKHVTMDWIMCLLRVCIAVKAQMKLRVRKYS